MRIAYDAAKFDRAKLKVQKGSHAVHIAFQEVHAAFIVEVLCGRMYRAGFIRKGYKWMLRGGTFGGTMVTWVS